MLSSHIKPYLISENPSIYDSNYKHRIYEVSNNWDPNKDRVSLRPQQTPCYCTIYGLVQWMLQGKYDPYQQFRDPIIVS